MGKHSRTQEQREQDWKDAVKEMLPFFGPKLPMMGNVTDVALVDSIGRMKRIEKDAKQVIGILQTILDTKIELADGLVVRGEQFEVKIGDGRQARLSADLARTEIVRLVTKVNTLMKALGQEPDEEIALSLSAVTTTVGEFRHNYDEI